MIYLQTFLYYTVFSSIVLIYGVGLNRIAEFGISQKNDFFFFLKAIVSIFTTSMISWVIISRILVPLKLVELYPITTFIVFATINSLLEGIIRIITGKNASEFIVTYLIILLSLTESSSLINTLIICGSSIVSILLIIPFCFTFKARSMANGKQINEKYYSLFFIFLSILILMMSVWDIIWITPGVLK